MTASFLPLGRRAARAPTEQLRFLGFAQEMEESGPPRLASSIVYTIAAVMVGGIAWAALTPVHQVAVAPGQIVPSGSISAVQHLEGGIVRRVLVEDGAIVSAGQPIVELDDVAATSELNALRSREATLAFQVRRLSAFVHGGELRGRADDDGGREALSRAQSAILEAQRETREQQRTVLERQRSAKITEQATLEAQIDLARGRAALAIQEREARRELFQKGLTTRSAFIDAQRAENRAQSDLAELLGQSQRNAEAVLESEARLAELNARLISEAEVEMGQVSADLAQVREAMTKLGDRAERLVVRAPVSGRVKDLKVRTSGSVVAPGMILAEIVPQDQRLLVEARLSARDVGHAKPGQAASVKIESYSYSIYGAVPGRLARVAASTTTDPDGNVYYKTIIELDRSHVGFEPDIRALRAGMTVQADIVTGEHSVLQHFFVPFQTTVSSALRER